jgi:hypothetical protein
MRTHKCRYFPKAAPKRIQLEPGLYRRIERVIQNDLYPVKPDLFATASMLVYHMLERFYNAFVYVATVY